MERFFLEISTPYFWFAVVGVGIAVNLLTALISKLAPRFGLSLMFWWRIRAKKVTDNQSQREKEFRTEVSIVADQPALISSFLVRAYALYVFGAAFLILGLFALFFALSIDNVFLYGAAMYSWGWWLQTLHNYSKSIIIFTIGIQVFKFANQRYLIATIAEERLMIKGLEALTSAALPAHRSEP